MSFENSEEDPEKISEKLNSELNSYDKSPNTKALIFKSGVIV